jgi:hypothetical protein
MYQAVMNLQCTCIERKFGISETVSRHPLPVVTIYCIIRFNIKFAYSAHIMYEYLLFPYTTLTSWSL